MRRCLHVLVLGPILGSGRFIYHCIVSSCTTGACPFFSCFEVVEVSLPLKRESSHLRISLVGPTIFEETTLVLLFRCRTTKLSLLLTLSSSWRDHRLPRPHPHPPLHHHRPRRHRHPLPPRHRRQERNRRPPPNCIRDPPVPLRQRSLAMIKVYRTLNQDNLLDALESRL
jgi:hypothetical protein